MSAYLRTAHLLAVVTSVIWGTTLISTKVLLHHGLSPEEIMLYRFVLAYIFLWVLHPRMHRIASLKEETLFLLTGLFGGSVYFITENTALELTQASDVGLIVAIAPLLTALLAHFLLKGERLNRRLITGSLIALTGVALVIFNGRFVLQITVSGYLLSLAAALSWAFYSICYRKIGNYPVLFVTRRIFFYGLLTLAPYFLFNPARTPLSTLLIPEVALNLLFLGLIASSLCFVMWNIAINRLGAVKTSNYIYLVPGVTIVTAALILHEIITPYAIIGAALILLGVYLAENDLRFPGK